MVRVLYIGIIKSVLGIREDQIDVPDGATVMMLLKRLEEKYGSRFTDQVFDTETSIREEALIVVDGNSIKTLQGANTLLSNSSEALVVILTPVSAGG